MKTLQTVEAPKTPRAETTPSSPIRQSPTHATPSPTSSSIGS